LNGKLSIILIFSPFGEFFHRGLTHTFLEDLSPEYRQEKRTTFPGKNIYTFREGNWGFAGKNTFLIPPH